MCNSWHCKGESGEMVILPSCGSGEQRSECLIQTVQKQPKAHALVCLGGGIVINAFIEMTLQSNFNFCSSGVTMTYT